MCSCHCDFANCLLRGSRTALLFASIRVTGRAANILIVSSCTRGECNQRPSKTPASRRDATALTRDALAKQFILARHLTLICTTCAICAYSSIVHRHRRICPEITFVTTHFMCSRHEVREDGGSLIVTSCWADHARCSRRRPSSHLYELLRTNRNPDNHRLSCIDLTLSSEMIISPPSLFSISRS